MTALIRAKSSIRRLSPRRQADSFFRTPLYRNSVSLIASNTANATLGMAYWVVAARMLPAEVVGQGAAAVSAMLLISLLGWAGLQPTLIRFIGVAGFKAQKLLITSYASAAVVALAASVVFLIAVHLWIDSLSFLGASFGIFFAAAAILWTVFSLQDSALTGLRRTVWVPVENTAFGLIKIGLLIVLSLWSESPWIIFASWALAALVLAVPVNAALMARFIPEGFRTAEINRPNTAPLGEGDDIGPHEKPRFTFRDISRFAVGSHVSALLIGIPDGLMPVLVVAIAGPEAGAFFYAPRTLIMSVRLVAVSLANALTAEGSATEARLSELVRRTSRFGLVIFLPMTIFFLLFSEPVLRIFGSEYADEGVNVLRFLALGLIPFAATNIWLGLARVRRQVGYILLVAFVNAVVNLGLSISLLTLIGIEGVAIAWMVTQSAAAGLVILLLLSKPTAARPAFLKAHLG